MTSLHVLLVEDDEDDATLILRELRHAGYELLIVERVATADGLRTALARHAWDLITCDYKLPAFGALDALTLIREHDGTVPIVIVSGEIGEELTVAFIRAGADDLVLKRNLGRLPGAVEHALRDAENRRRRAAAEAAQQEEARISAALARIGQECVASVETAALLHRVCRATTEVLDCDYSHTALWDPEEGAFTVVAGHDTPEHWERVRAATLPLALVADRVAALKQHGIVEVGPSALARDPGGVIDPTAAEASASLYVALWHGEELIGIHAAGYRRPVQGFARWQRRVATGIGHLTSLALDNAHLLERVTRSDRIKSEFLSTMSHELRTPLNHIIGFNDLLLEEAEQLTAEQADMLQAIGHSGRDLLALVNGILDVQRFEAAPAPPPAVTDVAELVRQLTTAASRTCPSDLHVGCQLPSELPAVRTDPAKLKSVLQNLIGNAVKFTPRGSVTISAEPRDDGVLFTVADTGVGIPPEVLPIIFEPFRQGDASLTRQHGGVGLGLYIVRCELERLGGEVTVESAVGRGSTFRVWIPCEQRSSAEPVVDPRSDAPTLYAEILDATNDLVHTASADGRLLYANRAWRTALGYGSDELRHLSLDDIVHPQSRAEIHQARQRALGGDPVDGLRVKYIAKDGRTLELEGSIRCRFANGEAPSMLGVYQNVTERADAQRQAEARRQLLETLLASLPAGVWITDATGRINQANPAAQRIWGGTHYVGIEEYGRYKGWFVPSGKPIAVEEWAAARAIRRGETIVDEPIEIESFDGTHKIILSSATPLRDAAGDIAGAIVVNHDITALRQTEEALRDSEQRFRTLIEQAADGIYVHDLLGVIAEVNPQVCESLGYTRGELIGRPLTDIDQQLDPDRVRQHLLQLESGAPVVIDTVHRRKDRSTFPVEVRAVRITWNGQPHVLGTCRDVTERKEAERALHASEERFALAVHGSTDGIWDWDLETNRIYHSPRWLQMLGLTDDVPGGDDIATWVSWLHPDDRERVASTLFAHLEGRTSHYECEQRLLHTDGTYRWMLARGICQREANGKPYRMSGADTDLTERKRMEEAFRLAEEQLRSAVEASRSGLWDHDLTTDVTRFSREWKAQLGYADDEIADRYEEWETRLHPDDRAQTLATVRECRMPPWPDYEAEFRLRHKDGSYRWILARGRVLRDANGQPWHMMGAQVDLTERKQAEDALREARAALEIAVLAARAGLWDWDLQTGKTHYADSWRTLFGYSPAEFDGSLEAWTTLVHPEDLERLAHSARGLVEASTSPYEAEFRVRRSDGTYRWVLSRATVLCDAGGTPQRVVGAHVDITDRKQTELALQEAQASLTLATESAKVAVWKCNLRTLTIHFSSGWNRILGREEGEIPLTALWELVHPDDRAKTTDAMQEHLQGRAAAYETEQRMLHADGSYRWVLSRGVVSPDTEGRPFLWFGADIDITDQKALEETLQRSEEGLRALAETLEQQVAERTRELSVTVERLRRSVDSLRVAEALSQLGSWEWDLSRDEVHWSNEQYRIFGFEPGARLTFSRVLDAVDREERSAVEQAIRDVLAGTRPLDVQCRIVQPLGEARWVHARAEVYRDGDGKPVRMVGAVLDITEHRRSEDRIRRSESRLQAIIAAEPECVKVIAPDGTLVDMNAAGLAMIEADSLEQVRGQQVGELVTEAYRDAFRKLMARACAGGEGTLEFEIVGLKGTHRWLETHAVPLPHDPDEVGMALGVTRDVTERKRAEDALLQLSADLEHRVLERTTQLEAANQELETFSYSVSHDLRTPLRHIDGFSRMLLEDYSEKLDDDGRRYLDRIQAGCQRMGQLIDDLLALSRVSRQPLRRERVDLSALAHGVVAELQAANPDRTVDVVFADGIAAHGDASLLSVVLGNLLGNAWKYTAKRPRARIEFGMSAGERGRGGAGETSATRLPSNSPAVFFVRDNGAGFDPAFTDKLFTPFQRLHSPAEFEGTGIGLAIVARIIRRHGGQVWAEGAVGQGATFYFSLGDSASAAAKRPADGASPPYLASENRH